MLSQVYNQGILYEGMFVSFVKYKLCIIYIPNLITYGSIIPIGVFYVIQYSTLSRGRKDCNTFHGVLTVKFRPIPNKSGSAAGLTQFTKPKISLYLAMHA